MRIVEIREKSVPMGAAMRNAVIDFSKMTVSAVAVVTDVIRDGKPIIGFGFNSNGRYAQGEVIRARLAPRILDLTPEQQQNQAGDNLDPKALRAAMMQNEKPGGHGERAVAVAAIEIALWDAAAKVAGVPLWRLLGGEAAENRVFVYAAGGYYDEEKGIPGLLAEVRGYLDTGYGWVKIKIGGAPLDDDIRRIEAVLELLGGDGGRLAVDANGRFDIETALKYGAAMAPYGLRWFEEPGDPLDYALNAEIVRCYPHAVATGENLLSLQDATNLIRHGGLRRSVDYLQFDPALAYGVLETIAIVDMMQELGWSPRRFIPHGGNLLALALTGALNLGGCESYPGVFQPFGGFADDTPIEDGYVMLPDAPGIGFERKAALYDVLKRLLD
ncbi:MAG: mandelate racemase [Proteobacteria bacterium]|nr:mandelate racemase [Pseudomonadota bacterium]MDA1357195.1 mandelate racemase [Pseudomonadota bacterium]